MTTAVLYARYSTAMQSAASAEDQLRLLRERAAREGWAIASELADRAISGTVRARPGLIAALAAIEDGQAQILLAESLDRLSRDQEDLAALYKRVRFAGARIITLSEGEAGAMHIGLGATMSAIMLEQLGEKVRRGQRGRVEAGRIPGGLSYGYRKRIELRADGEPERGLRQIDAAQAAIVQRIFREYVAGDSPLTIARRLNAEGVPGPRGGLWRANAISGSRSRANGVLHNRLYRGIIAYNRQSFRKDPLTRKRVSRANADSDIVEHHLPELEIVDAVTWQAAQDLLARYGTLPARQAKRPRRLLSGLVTCGCCGGSYTAISNGYWGCSNYRQTRTCDNKATVRESELEQRLWTAIRDNLLHPDVAAAYLDELRKATAEMRRDAIKTRASANRRMAELEQEESRIVAAIAAGIPLDSLKDRATAIKAERKRLAEEVAMAEAGAPDIAVHPGLIHQWRQRVTELHQLAAEDTELRREARSMLEQLVARIETTPRANGERGVDLVVHGKLAALLAPVPDFTLEVVAGVGFEPTTFRL